jgi:hypothetical protein
MSLSGEHYKSGIPKNKMETLMIRWTREQNEENILYWFKRLPSQRRTEVCAEVCIYFILKDKDDHLYHWYEDLVQPFMP